MALPQNYKQIGMNMPGGQSSHHHMMSGMPQSFNILKERLRQSGGSSERNKDNSSPFIHSPHGNPAFTPQKLGKASAALESRTPKPPKPPEKPIMPFMRYSRKVWDDVKAKNPEMKLWEVGQLIGEMWKDLPATEKQEVIDEYEAERIDYEKSLKIYHNSPAYLAFLSAKTKSKSGTDSDNHETTPRSSSKSQQQDRRIDIQPAEDEDDQDDGYSVKHVAYARYIRNHRLINEIFSDMAVPDIRTIVTTSRMQILRRQVHSLTMHQSKLETELAQMEEKFEAKKRKLIESSELFQEELKKHCKPAVDDEKFQQMVEKQYELCKERMKAAEENPQSKTPVPSSVQPVKADAVEEPTNTITAPDAQPSTASNSATVVNETSQSTDPEPMQVDEEPKPSPVKEEIKEEIAASPLVTPKEESQSDEKVVTPPPPTQSPIVIESAAPIAEPEIKSEEMKEQETVTVEAKTEPPASVTPTPTPPPVSTAHYAPITSAPGTIPTDSVHPPVASVPGHPIHNENQAPVPPPSVVSEHHQQAPTPIMVPPQHHGGPPMHHHPLPPHVAGHQGIPTHPGMPGHAPYANYSPASGPPRTPYYPQQYPTHPGQSFPQYPPYPYHQQYVQPPAHYMPPRPGSSPIHYPDHAGGPQQAPMGPPIGESGMPPPHTAGNPYIPPPGAPTQPTPAAPVSEEPKK